MRYLIKLRPIETFFFGSEITFGQGAESNYLVKSNYFPQQTSLLGFIRKEILIQNGIFKQSGDYSPEEKTKISELIGKESFSLKETELQNFGVINTISPVFIVHDDYFYVPAPKDNGLSFKQETGLTSFSADCIKTFIPNLDKYKAKTGINRSLIDSKNSNPLTYDAIFKPVERIGIRKSRDGQTQEDAFYKQTSYRFLEPDKTYFAFILDVADAAQELTSSLVTIGADNSVFKMTAEKNYNHNFTDVTHRGESKDKLILLSDAIVEENVYEQSDFAITETLDFRNLKSSTGDYSFKKEGSKYTMLQRGSVFFSKEPNKFKEIFTHKNLNKIGYNIVNIL